MIFARQKKTYHLHCDQIREELPAIFLRGNCHNLARNVAAGGGFHAMFPRLGLNAVIVRRYGQPSQVGVSAEGRIFGHKHMHASLRRPLILIFVDWIGLEF